MAARGIGGLITKFRRVPKCLTVTTWRRVLLAIAVVGLALSSAACGATGSAATASDTRAQAPADAKPGVLSVRYGWFRPGVELRPYTVLVIKARDADGRIVSVTYQQLDADGAVIAHSPCGLGGKSAGQTETFRLPINLRPGRHRFRVTVWSSSCGKPGGPQTASRTFTVLAR